MCDVGYLLDEKTNKCVKTLNECSGGGGSGSTPTPPPTKAPTKPLAQIYEVIFKNKQGLCLDASGLTKVGGLVHM